MAQWQPIIVSGSNNSLLNNDAGYISSSQVPNSFSTASFNGVDLLADSQSGKLNFASGSTGLNIVANAVTDTLTFDLVAVPNSSLANDSVTIGTTEIDLGTTATTLAGLTSVTSTTFVGDLTGNASTATAVGNSLTDGDGIADFDFDGSSAATVSVQVDGSTLAVGGLGVKVADAGITETQLNTSVAGAGLAGGAGTALSVNVDGTTIEIATDTLQVKNGGISFAKLAADSVVTSVEGISNATSGSDDNVATTKAIIDYVDAQVGGATLNIESGNDASSIAIDLNDETLTITGNEGLTVNNAGNDVGIGITDGGINAVKLNSDVAGDGLTSTSGVLSLTEDSITIGNDIVALGGSTTLAATGFNSGSFSGSFQGDGSGLTGIAATLDILGDSGTGTVDLKTEDLDIAGGSNITTTAGNQTITVALNDSITITDATITGDLVVQGTASFQHETNLEVADRFILLASGSSTTGDGGIIVQQATQDVGDVFGFDGLSGTERWGIGQVQNAASSSFTPEAFMSAVIVGGVGENDPSGVDARYVQKGNMFIGDNGAIYIFS